MAMDYLIQSNRVHEVGEEAFFQPGNQHKGTKGTVALAQMLQWCTTLSSDMQTLVIRSNLMGHVSTQQASGQNHQILQLSCQLCTARVSCDCFFEWKEVFIVKENAHFPLKPQRSTLAGSPSGLAKPTCWVCVCVCVCKRGCQRLIKSCCPKLHIPHYCLPKSRSANCSATPWVAAFASQAWRRESYYEN